MGVFDMVKKGSMTVEVACMMSLILLILMGLLYLFFFVHNRSWLTAAAYESALSGSIEGITETGNAYEAAEMKSRELGNTGFFGAENLQAQTNAGKKVQVTYDLDTIASFGNFQWHLRVEGSSKIIQPVKWIRKVKAAADLVKGAG